jgi:hypothetical protein
MPIFTSKKHQRIIDCRILERKSEWQIYPKISKNYTTSIKNRFLLIYDKFETYMLILSEESKDILYIKQNEALNEGLFCCKNYYVLTTPKNTYIFGKTTESITWITPFD